MKPVKTYFLLADEKEARVLENDGVGKGIFQISRLTAEDAGVVPPDFADQPTSARGSGGAGRHGIEPATSLRESARDRFADYLVETIVELKKGKKFDRFVVCAAPQLLGELRGEFEGKVEIYADLDKNLVNTALDELPAHLSKIVAV